MQTRNIIRKRLSFEIQNRMITVPELCDALGINAAGLTASALFDRIVAEYCTLRGIA